MPAMGAISNGQVWNGTAWVPLNSAAAPNYGPAVPTSGGSSNLYTPASSVDPNPNGGAPGQAGTTGDTGTPGGAGNTNVDPVTGQPAIGLAPLTGWAATQNFTPEQLRDTLYQNPWYLIPRILGEGANTSSPGYAALRDIGGDPISLYNIMWGSQNMGSEDSSLGEFANFYADLIQNLGTAGGKAINGHDLLQAIMNADTSQEGQQKTGLNLLLGSAGNSSDSARILYQLFRDVTNASGMDPLQARARQAGMVNALDDYGSQMLSTNAADVVSPNQWLKTRYPGLFV